ncbi:MAG: DUF3572 domain-containing protein [Alphaproteobacteria bacterium]
MQRNEAETLALKGLGWLAGDPETLLRFLDASGLEANDLRERAADPELLAAVMDYILADDALTAAFGESESLDAQQLHRARLLLPGGKHEG